MLKFKLKNKRKPRKTNIIDTIIWIGYLTIIIALYFIFQDNEYMRFLSIGALMFWLAASIIPMIVDRTKSDKVILTYPLVTYLHRTVIISVAIGFLYVFIMGTVLGSAVQLYSTTQMKTLPVALAVLFFGFVMVAVEEKNWGMWIQPTLEYILLKFKGLSPFSAFVVMVLLSMVSFASVHFWVGKIVVAVVIGAAILRGVICIVNKITNSYLSGIIIHRIVQAVALSVIFIESGTESILFVVVILMITLAPYYVLPWAIKK